MNNTALIVALDVPNMAAMEKKLRQMPDFIEWYKIGLELFCAEGPSVLELLGKYGKNIFLDLKLHDIPRTVGNAIKAAAAHGVDLMTIHAAGGRAMLEEAVRTAAICAHPPALAAVTTLTSLERNDLTELGVSRAPAEQAVMLGHLAISAGVDGLVSSAHETGVLRAAFPDAMLVVPGIRMPGNNADDQKRIATPSFAVEQGATHLVVGRPITQAENPDETTSSIMAEIIRAKQQ